MLLPPVKLKLSFAMQPSKVKVPAPATTVFGEAVPSSNKPPVVSKSCTGIEVDPAAKLPIPVYQRCPAAPAPAPFGAYVIQAKKSTPETGLTSTVRPWPDVAAS